MIYIFQQPNHPHGRGRIDGNPLGLVIEAYIAANNRSSEYLAGLAQAKGGLLELPHDFRLFWIAEVQTVGNGHRLTAGTDNIPRSLCNCDHPTSIRIQIAVSGVAVSCHCQALGGPLDPYDSGIGARENNGVGPYHMIILPVNPSLTCNSWRVQQFQQDIIII